MDISKGQLENGHDCRLSHVVVTDEEVALLCSSAVVYFDRDDGLTDTWFARGPLSLRRPKEVRGNTRPAELWIYECELEIDGRKSPLEALLLPQRDVSLRITWNDGTTLSILAAEEASLSLELYEREGAFDFRALVTRD